MNTGRTHFKKGCVPWNKGTRGICKSNSGSFSKGESPHNKGKIIFVIKDCVNCGDEFEMQFWKGAKQECCSKGCATSYRQKGKPMSYARRVQFSLAKTNDLEFTGFRNKLTRSIRVMGKYLKWRADVLKRDNYHCQECGNKEQLEAHHIIAFSKIIKEYNLVTLDEARECDVLWDTGNGITYCKKCHIKNDPNIGIGLAKARGVVA